MRVKRVHQIHHRTIFDLLRKMVRWCIRLTCLTLVCEVIRYRLVQVRQNLKKKRLFGLAASYCHFLSLPPSFSSSSYFLSFSKPKAYHGIRHSSTGLRKIVMLQGTLFRKPFFYNDHFFLHCGVRQALLYKKWEVNLGNTETVEKLRSLEVQVLIHSFFFFFLN